MSTAAPFTASIAAMYQDALLAHHRAPHNRRVIESPTAVGARKNPVCGDDITVMVSLESDAVRDVAFTGRSCSIATASASMMTDAVRGLSVSEALALADAVDRMLHPDLGGASGADAAPEPLPDALTPLRGVAPFPGRHGCAMLPWQALREALTAKR
ncbi:Fe-S cluster assembly sulfur transfer protein SufU [Gemmatimonas sp.]|uniref:Fe-S cluster assembly sulfur transfer protein SufU n=1 Tax=Gemmatimonas sp. TaxID=1962908 RepID=UPI00286DC04D|nr:SUF system NifU family Fe-S cluster assembly protein [Gemmatimonas sp.]